MVTEQPLLIAKSEAELDHLERLKVIYYGRSKTLCAWCGAHAVEGSTCPRSMPCPHCHARPGGPCKRPSGHEAPGLHEARYLAAEYQDLERNNA